MSYLELCDLFPSAHLWLFCLKYHNQNNYL